MIDIVGDAVAVTAFEVATGVGLILNVSDIDWVRDTLGVLLFIGIVICVKELLGVKDTLGVFEIGEPVKVVLGDIVGDTIAVIDPYDWESKGLLVLVIGDCDKVFDTLPDTDVLVELVWVWDGHTLNVFKDVCDLDCTGELVIWLLLLILVKGDEVYDVTGHTVWIGVCEGVITDEEEVVAYDPVTCKLDVCCGVDEPVITEV